MPLLTKISEIRAVLPRLISTLSDNANLPNIDKAQRKYIMKLLGKELIENLQTKYDANPTTLSNPEKELLKHIQLPLAAYAIVDDMAFIQSTITDNGIRTASTDKMQAAHRWEFNEIRNTLNDYAMDGVEILLGYLYEKQADYPLWTQSLEYKEINALLIHSGTDFGKQYPLYQPLYTYWTLKPVMVDVEENYLVSALGRDLLAWVKSRDAVDITVGVGLIDVKKLLKKAVAFLTIKHACEHFTPRFDKNGFTVLHSGSNEDDSTSGRSAASERQIEIKKEACDRDGQNYLSKSANYLIGIARGIYNEDFGSDFLTAFEFSPLNFPIDTPPWTNGNERRKIFRF